MSTLIYSEHSIDSVVQYGLRFPRSSLDIPVLFEATFSKGKTMQIITRILAVTTLVTDLYITSLIIFALLSSKTGG
jgi:hypothetical protein